MVNDYQDRAKQFMPFDALKGLQDELRKKESNLEKLEKEDLTKIKKLQFTASSS